MALVVIALVLVGIVSTSSLLVSLASARRLRLVSQAGGLQSGQDALPRALGVSVAPFEAETLDGERLNEAEFATGSRVVAFFAVDCQPCERIKEELLNNPPRERFIVFFQGEDPDGLPDFVTSFRALAGVVWARFDQSVQKAFSVDGFPLVLRVVDGIVVDATRNPQNIGLAVST